MAGVTRPKYQTKATPDGLSLALHALFMSTALLGTSGRPPSQPLTEGAASSPNKDATEFVSILLLLNDHSITPPDQPPDESAYEMLKAAEQPAKEAVLLTTIETPTPPGLSGSDAGTDDNAPTAEATGDDPGRAMLSGCYIGQIKAHIERAWEQPDSPTIQRFDCKVQVKQNSQGDVQGITLQRCNNDPAWQVSLVQAIQRASPLSAPPNEAVFSDVITSSFAVDSTMAQ